MPNCGCEKLVDKILRQYPNSSWAWSLRAYFELYRGSPGLAEIASLHSLEEYDGEPKWNDLVSQLMMAEIEQGKVAEANHTRKFLYRNHELTSVTLAALEQANGNSLESIALYQQEFKNGRWHLFKFDECKFVMYSRHYAAVLRETGLNAEAAEIEKQANETIKRFQLDKLGLVFG